MGFFRQEYGSELPFPTPGNISDPGIEPTFHALKVDSLLSEPSRKTISMPYKLSLTERYMQEHLYQEA